MTEMKQSIRVKGVLIAALAVILPATAALAAYNSANWNVSNRIGIGTDVPRHRLSAIGGPAWTNRGWTGSLELGNAGAIAWRANSSGALFGMGYNNAGFSMFRTKSNTATTTGTTGPADFYINNFGRFGLGSGSPLHRVSIGPGPSWTSSLWSGAVDLLNGAAIGWRVNNAGLSVGMGHTNGGFHIFRTSSSPATTGSSAVYDFTIGDSGNVGIGTTSPSYKLHVGGSTWVEGGNLYVTGGGIFVGGTQLNVPDYVFAPDYKLRTLNELRTFIAQNNHLPNVPPAKRVQAGNLDLVDFQMRLLEKIEELTLYTLAQDDRLTSQQQRIDTLTGQNESALQRIAAIEARLPALHNLTALGVSPSND